MTFSSGMKAAFTTRAAFEKLLNSIDQRPLAQADLAASIDAIDEAARDERWEFVLRAACHAARPNWPAFQDEYDTFTALKKVYARNLNSLVVWRLALGQAGETLAKEHFNTTAREFGISTDKLYLAADYRVIYDAAALADQPKPDAFLFFAELLKKKTGEFPREDNAWLAEAKASLQELVNELADLRGIQGPGAQGAKIRIFVTISDTIDGVSAKMRMEIAGGSVADPTWEKPIEDALTVEGCQVLASPELQEKLLKQCSDGIEHAHKQLEQLGRVPFSTIPVVFIVPRILVNLAYDWIEFKKGATMRVLGGAHPVSVRVQERDQYKSYCRHLEAHQMSWRLIRPLPVEQFAGMQRAVNRLASAAVDSNNTTQLVMDVLEQHEIYLSTLTSVPLSPSSGGNESDIIHNLMSAGVPAMLWLRTGSGNVNLLTELVTDRAFAELSEAIRNKRLEATNAGAAAHDGRHLTFLCDTPPLVQTGNRLEAPTTTANFHI